MKHMVIYHEHCIDGITSATVVVKHLIDNLETNPEDVSLCAMSYDDPIPALHEAIIQEKIDRLWIVDFSFSIPVLLNLHTIVPSIELYDHHASAFRNLMGADYPLGATSKENFFLRDDHNDPTKIHIVLDNSECGASLCYKWLINPPSTFDDVAEQQLPTLIKYVRDYDLWRFNLPETKAINKVLKGMSKDIATYTALLISFDEPLVAREFAKQGQVILEYEDKIENELISQGVSPVTINDISGLVVNAPYAFASNIGHKLALESKTFGATWSQKSDGVVGWSLRSNGDECDVSKLAELMGGGGHKNAAGFTLSAPSFDEEKGITLWMGADYACAEQEHEIAEEDGATNG